MSEEPQSTPSKQDRRLEELLAEIRVIVPGVTVLFAFLLTLPFTAGFEGVTAAQRVSYFVAFMGAALAMILLTAPSAYHRLRGKPYDKALMLRTANRQAIAALVLLAAAMTAVIFLVTDVLYPGPVAAPLTAGVLAVILGSWFVLPLARRLRQDE